MPLSKRVVGTLLGAFLFAANAFAEIPAQPLHWSGDKTFWDRKNNVVQLIGNAVVNKEGENLKADTITLDMNKRLLRARGNCVYLAGGTLIHAEEIHFNIDTSAGTVIQGRVTDGSYLLTGQRINRLSYERYQAHRATYTTCWDCPGSWSFEADDIDIEFEQYATMTNVMAKIGGTPILWFPYLILPVKTKRQTGLLAPKLGFDGGHGVIFVPQFYWATTRSLDMTFGAGTYANRGFRGEWEGRYALAPTSFGTGNLFYINDSRNEAKLNTAHRYALTLKQQQELPFEIIQKSNLYYISDNLYPTTFADVPGSEEPYLASDLMISKSTPLFSGYIAGRIYRNLIRFSNERDPTTGAVVGPNYGEYNENFEFRDFDTKTVQLFPQVELRLNDVGLFGLPIRAGFTGGLSHFWRDDRHFDNVCEASTCGGSIPTPVPGTDPIRRGIRYTMVPSLYTTLRPFDVFSFVPSVNFYGYYYDFQSQFTGAYNSLFRGYLQLQADLSMQFEKVFDTDYARFPRVKHTIRPLLRYSLIPYRFEDSNHPFMRQIASQQGFKFDNLDVVPYSRTPSIDSYFTPLGHSLTYGLTTQWMRRASEANAFQVPASETFLEAAIGQTIDFTQFQESEATQVPFSRFFLTTRIGVDKFSADSTYYYYPYVNRLISYGVNQTPSPHWINIGGKYTFESSSGVGGTGFERSVWARFEYRNLTSWFTNLKGGFTFSISDYIQPSAWVEYDFFPNYPNYPNGRLQKVASDLIFQSPARCWRIVMNLSRDFITPESYLAFKFVLDLNWSGTGYGGVPSIAK